MIKRALVSVSDKTGIVELARRLAASGVEIISTGGTAGTLREAGIQVTGISDVTGFPEIMDGRVKTLHPAVHGGLLARRDVDEHMKAIESLHIKPIDMVVVNLYPFRKTIAKPGVSLDETIENIDIGGPSMVRSAAKNHKDVIIMVNPARYDQVLQYIENKQDVPLALRFELAVEAFEHTAAYDSLIAAYFGQMVPGKTVYAEDLTLRFEKAQDLRYGENPHQKAALYRDPLYTGPSVVGAEQFHGLELSYNNIADADAALAIALEFTEPCCVAVKHANPCGVGIAPTLAEAYKKAYDGDTVSIYGGVVAMNRTLDLETAQRMAGVLLDIIIAPGYTDEALALLKKRKNTRVLKYDGSDARPSYELKKVAGGLLMQDTDLLPVDAEHWKVVSKRQPTQVEMRDMKFGWKVMKYVKSNAIVLAKDEMTVGIGPGQPNRVDSTRIATSRAGQNAKGSVLCSDAYFPFPDVVEVARAAGVTAMVQPGGSIRDEDSIKAADEYGMCLIFTGTRHFKH